jgi:signal peptidase II
MLIIALDQGSKLLVYQHMTLGYEGQIKVIGDWFRLYYVLNPGIAFGINFDIPYSKLLLTLFRIMASGAIGYFLYYKIKQNAQPGFLVCIALILAGALGNVIDSVFFGVFLENNAIPGAITPWFHGQVIDMLYFPLIESTFPSWVPIWGGEPFLFFSAIFNVADASIFLGVVFILVFQKKFLPSIEGLKPTAHEESVEKEEEADESEKTSQP